MIWILLLICIYGTIFCIEQLFNILGSLIFITTINQTINILPEKENLSETIQLINTRDKVIKIRNNAQRTFNISSIILSALWTLFFYLWN